MHGKTRSRRVRAAAIVAGVTAAGLALSGCAFGQLQLRTVADVTSSAAKISLAAGKAEASGQLAPDRPLVVSVAAGRLTSVTVTGPDGALDGSLSADSTTWTSDVDSLDYGSQYQIAASAVDRLGVPATVTESVQTLQPDKFLKIASVAPSGTVGIGIPMKVTLSRSVAGEKARQQVESHMVVKADGKVITNGAWRWNSGTEVMFRPESYWPGNSKITLESSFKGVRISKSVWGKTDSVNTWHTGPAMISYVNLQTHMMKVTRNGKTIRNIPIAAGKPGFETRSGIKVILTKERTRRMDAATGGTAQDSPEYYDLVVEYAMRLTWSGEFLHAAPWSVANQGVYNSSHGCTGMSTANAEWLYNESEIGDVVVFTGSNRHMTMDNGIGDWNVPLDRWAAGYDS